MNLPPADRAHITGCVQCAAAVTAANPPPFNPAGCHYNLAPGHGWDGALPVQCPHPAAPGSTLCARHLADAHAAWLATGITALENHANQEHPPWPA